MRMAAIYARVSSEQQREAHTIASQTAALADFGHDRHGRDQRDPAQRLEGVEHGAHGRRGHLHGLIDRALEPFDPPHRVIDFVQIVQPRGLLCRVLELHLADPR